MGRIADSFPKMRDTRANVKEEIMSSLFYSEVPMSSRQLREVLVDRHGWVINVKTVFRFTKELVEAGKVKWLGRVVMNGRVADVYVLSDEERKVRRGSYATDAVQSRRPVHG